MYIHRFTKLSRKTSFHRVIVTLNPRNGVNRGILERVKGLVTLVSVRDDVIVFILLPFVKQLK